MSSSPRTSARRPFSEGLIVTRTTSVGPQRPLEPYYDQRDFRARHDGRSASPRPSPRQPRPGRCAACRRGCNPLFDPAVLAVGSDDARILVDGAVRGANTIYITINYHYTFSEKSGRAACRAEKTRHLQRSRRAPPRLSLQTWANGERPVRPPRARGERTGLLILETSVASPGTA
jgi:hypothetical protein